MSPEPGLSNTASSDSLSLLLQDEQRRQALFPHVARGPYLAHAGVAPLCAAAASAVADWAQRSTDRCQEDGWVWQQVAGCRRAAATLIGAEASDISLIGPTTYGIAQVANGWPWQAGDEVIYYQHDYPANVYPWSHLQERGVQVRSVRPSRPGVITWDSIAEQLSPRSTLVALASCHYLSGYRIDLATIGHQLRQRNIIFALDGIQTLGAFPTLAAHADFIAADGHKWLMAPGGAGFLYSNPRLRDTLEPLARGSWNVNSPEFVAQPQQELMAGGRRFECGTLNLPGIIGLRAGIEQMLTLGIDAIGHQLIHLRSELLQQLRPAGWYSIHHDEEDQADAAQWQSGIVTLRHNQRDLDQDAAALQAAGMLASRRLDQHGQAWLRLSPHGYMTAADLAPAIALLSR